MKCDQRHRQRISGAIKGVRQPSRDSATRVVMLERTTRRGKLLCGAQVRGIMQTRYVLALALAVVFGLFFVIPARDLPETPYDESETLPYENTASLSGEIVQAPARILPLTPRFDSSVYAGHVAGRTEVRAKVRAKRREQAVDPIWDCLIIFYPLLC
jgi:hypothetical protein